MRTVTRIFTALLLPSLASAAEPVSPTHAPLTVLEAKQPSPTAPTGNWKLVEMSF